MRVACICLLFAGRLHSAVIDRVDIVVGQDVITELQLEEEMAVTALLNRTPIVSTPAERRGAAHRLIEQTLIARDMEIAQFPPVEEAAVNAALASIQAEHGGGEQFQAELRRYHVTQAVLKRHLERQIATLRFIQYRFRPELTISDSDLQEAYRQQPPEWRQQNPSLDASRSILKTTLVEQRTDQALESWLSQAGVQARITYLDPELKTQ